MIRVPILSVLLALPAMAQSIYSWTDPDGTTHFTDDPRTVPKGAKASAAIGSEVNVIVAEGPPDEPAPRATPPSMPPAKVLPPGVPSAAEQYWRKAFRDANLKVRQLEDEIASDAKVVEEVNGMPIRGHMRCGYGYAPITPAPVVGWNTGVAVTTSGQVVPNVGVSAAGGTHWVSAPVGGCTYQSDPEWERIKHRLGRNRIALERAKEDLADLERRASFESVPREWRR